MQKGIIPKNVNDYGFVLGGKIKTRNLIEAGAAVLIGWFVLKYTIGLFLPVIPYYVSFILIEGLIFIIFIIGKNGMPITTFIYDTFKYGKTCGVYIYKVPRPEEEKEVKSKRNIFKFRKGRKNEDTQS